MGTQTSTARSSTRTQYEWRWLDDHESEPFVIPDTWAANGRKEQPAEDEERFFAVEVKHGLVLEYKVDNNGRLITGPHREKKALRVLYVNAGGEKAIARQILAADNNADGIKPPAEFASIIADNGGSSYGEYGPSPAAKRAVASKYEGTKVCVDDE